jgi:non-specific serine/threonine protein kinase
MNKGKHEMKSITGLITALQQGTMTLSAVIAAIEIRGAVPEADHRAEYLLLEQAREEGQLDAQVARELQSKIAAVQAVSALDNSADDATVVQPVESDATVIMPKGRARPGLEDDHTVVKPVHRAPEQDEVTVFLPAAAGATESSASKTGEPGSTGVGTASSSVGTASWRRIAEAEGGEFATVGMLLKGRFLLEREIGRGGMGVVFLARDERKVEARDRDPYVAVKVLNDDFRRHPNALIALQRESRRSQLLAHDNIVRVFDFDKDGTIVFMTMEYLDGSDLKTLIRERAYNGMSLAEARPLIEGMAWALKRAHSANVVHSDFKPGNVMVTRDGVPKVFDFGIARAAQHASGDAAEDKTLFDAGTLGALTPAYASLEMIQGEEPTSSDDIYALGCVIFELLTGKHPFNKASAEVAQREGRRPPAVPGLTRRQYKTLCDSVAFTRAQRLKSVEQLVEGLRDVSLCQRYGWPMAYGAGAVILLGLGGWGLDRYLYEQQVANVVARFSPTDPHHYVSVRQALVALNSLGAESRTDIVLQDGTQIQNFLLSRIRSNWNPDRGRYNFAGAEHVFQVRDQLRLYSPLLDHEHRRVERQRNSLLNTLDIQLMDRISKGAIFENQPHNVVATWTKIRAIDPTSAFLNNAQLEIQYDIAIGQSLVAGRIGQAQQQLALARRLFPNSKGLAVRAEQLAALQNSERVNTAPAAQRFQTVAQAESALAKLIGSPENTTSWQSQVAAAMVLLEAHPSPTTRQMASKLADVTAAMVSKENNVARLPQNIEMVRFGLRYVPNSPQLVTQRKRLAHQQQEQQMQLSQEAATAEIASRIESVRKAAAANDPVQAEQSLAKLRLLQPTNPFIKAQAPALIAAAYQRLAHDAFQSGKYKSAQSTLAAGITALGPLPGLVNAQNLYGLATALISAHGQPLAAADYQKLQTQLTHLLKVYTRGVQDLENELKRRGLLPQGTLSNMLRVLKPKNFVPNVPQTPAVRAPVNPVTKPSVVPEAKAAVIMPEILPSVVQKAEKSAAVPTTRHGSCAQPGMAGSGRICFSLLHDGQRGPKMVVIPGSPGSGKPYALSRADITINEFNSFCTSSHQCKAVAVPYSYAGHMPITNISLSEAQAYVHWLSSETGQIYALPTNAEWLHAAQANVNWNQAPDSDCLPPSSNGNNGAGGPIPAIGRDPNPWGLVNMTGDVWQWVMLPSGGVGERGGSYNSYWSSCTVNAYHHSSSSPRKDVGFRVLRKMR